MTQNLDPNEYYDLTKLHADNGEVSDAKELLHGFCTYYESKLPIPEPILEYLYESFVDYLHGFKSDIASSLRLKARAVRPKGITNYNPIPILSRLYLYVKRDGMTKEKAMETIIHRDGIGVDSRTIQRMDKEWNLIKHQSIEDLEILAKLPLRPDRN